MEEWCYFIIDNLLSLWCSDLVQILHFAIEIIYTSSDLLSFTKVIIGKFYTETPNSEFPFKVLYDK
jgi:hypothetical protein